MEITNESGLSIFVFLVEPPQHDDLTSVGAAVEGLEQQLEPFGLPSTSGDFLEAHLQPIVDVFTLLSVVAEGNKVEVVVGEDSFESLENLILKSIMEVLRSGVHLSYFSLPHVKRSESLCACVPSSYS